MSLSSTALIKIIRQNNLRIFTTADMLTLTQLSSTAATQALRRIANEKLLIRIKRGVWANQLIDNLNPMEAVPYLRAPWPAHVSLYSAISEWGLIEEIPHVIYAVTSAAPKIYRTPIGDFHIHRLPQRMIWGYTMRRIGAGSYPIAEPEKAFLDLVYLALIPRSTISFPYQRNKRWNLDKAKLKRYAVRFGFKPLTNYLKTCDLL